MDDDDPVGRIQRYLDMRAAQPVDGDLIHAIHTGTEFAAELRLSDLTITHKHHRVLPLNLMSMTLTQVDQGLWDCVLLFNDGAASGLGVSNSEAYDKAMQNRADGIGMQKSDKT